MPVCCSADASNFAYLTDARQLFAMQLINDALGELDKIINAAGRAMQDGSSHLIKSREEAQRKLDEAQAGVDKAQRDVESARGAFEAARRKVGYKRLCCIVS